MAQLHSHLFQETQNQPSVASASSWSGYPNCPTEGDHRRGPGCEDPSATLHSTPFPTMTLTAPVATDPMLYCGPFVHKNEFRDSFNCDCFCHIAPIVDTDPTTNLSGSLMPVQIAASGHRSTTLPFQPPRLCSPYDWAPHPSLASHSFPNLPADPSLQSANDTARPYHRPASFRIEVGSEARAAASLSRRSVSQRIGTYTCAYCPRTCTRRRTLDDHMLCHKNLRQYQCDQVGCGGARFNTESGLKSHLKRVHNLKLRQRNRSLAQSIIKTHNAQEQ